MSRRLLVAAGLAGLLSSGPAWPIFGDSEAHKRIDEQAKALQSVSEQLRSMADQLKAVDGRVGAVEGTVNGGTLLNLLNQIETLSAEIARLRGELERVDNRVEGADRRARDLYMDVDGRLRVLEAPSAAAVRPSAPAPSVPDPGLTPQPAPAETPPMPAVSTGAMPTPATAPSPSEAPRAAAQAAPATESAAYEAAHAIRREGRFMEAARSFQQFIASHPNSPLAAPAQYWTGDSLYNARDYAGAVVAQRRLLDTYPGSAKVPDAMLNMASALRDSGDVAGERRTLEPLVSRHPSSEASEKARRRMAGRN